MWARTRQQNRVSPNERIFQQDELRIRQAKQGERVFGGEWQLCYQVWNFAPALQLVGVEQLVEGAAGWRTIQSCHTVEFQTRAACRSSTIIREHAAAVEWNGDRSKPPLLRIFVRGVGQVKIGRITLARSNHTLAHKTRRDWVVIGQRAPAEGLPEMNWSSNQGELALNFC
jgi:hypothetical protein